MALLNEAVRAQVDRVLSAESDRFDLLLVAAGVNPICDLRYADLRDIKLADSILVGWDFTGADLTGASFAGARVENCTFDNAIGLDLAGAIINDVGDPQNVRATVKEFRFSAEQALAQFRAGLPIMISADRETIKVMPIDGADQNAFDAFRAASGPPSSLVITRQRARSLGIETNFPVSLDLSASDDAASVYALASFTIKLDRTFAATPAGPAASSALDLAKLSGRLPAVVARNITEDDIVGFDGSLLGVQANSLLNIRQELVRSLAIAGDARLPLQGGISARFVVFRNAIGAGGVAIIVGTPNLARPVPVRIHSACLTGDVFGSLRCDCGDQLRLALARLQAAGSGIILYLDQEGRGLGLVNKMRAYQLQDDGLDTVDANHTLGFDDDERDYAIAARMLVMLGCTRVLLLTNNPAQLDGLVDAGIELCGRLPLKTPINADNRRYMSAKARRAGRLLDNDNLVSPAGIEIDQPVAGLRHDE